VVTVSQAEEPKLKGPGESDTHLTPHGAQGQGGRGGRGLKVMMEPGEKGLAFILREEAGSWRK
jgi:hypothetical protein